MAIGDVVTYISGLIGTGAYIDYQPASGVEVVIFWVGSSGIGGTTPDSMPNVNIYLTDGSASLPLIHQTVTAASQYFRQKILLTNTNYMRINNASGTGEYLCYYGIQIK